MNEIEKLLKVELPHAYNLTRPNVSLSYNDKTGTFELGDKVACKNCKQRFPNRNKCNEKTMKVDSAGNTIKVVEYEDYINQFNGTQYAYGSRCDILMFDANDHKIAFCDLGCYSEKYVEEKRERSHKQTSDSLKRFLCEPCGKYFIDKFNEKVLIFGRRNPEGSNDSAPKRGDAQGNMLSFMMTPVAISKHAVSKEVVEGVEVSFVIVNYPNSYVW